MVQPVIMRIVILLLAPAVCLAQTCDTASAHKRYAFVLGNGTYASLLTAPTAEADAKAMQGALEGAGFLVTPLKNRAMQDLFYSDQKNFVDKIKPGDVVFLYYSGHIVQGPEGLDDDFILPSDFNPSREVTSALSLGRFLDDLSTHNPSLTIVMIEGPHPVDKEILGSRPGGLIVPDLSNNGKILFAMAAQPGQVAVTESGSATSLFTRTVAELLGKPGLSLSELFKQAKQDVANQPGRSQVPFFEDLSGDSGAFCFHEAIVTPPPPPPPPPKPEIKIETRIETVPIPSNKTDHEEYVRIAHGTFKMGCVPSDSRCKPEEKPQHEVTLSKDFYLGRNEVKVSSFRLFREERKIKKSLPSAPSDYDSWKIGELPQVRVTWEDANTYCEWAGGRLPTEAEWEYAARAGASGEIYPLNSENSRDKANFDGKKGNDIYLGVAPVRMFEPNNFRLYDMSGNVWEWVSDFYSPTYYAESPAVDPKGPTTGKEHVVRGGSFESDWKDHLRLSLRFLPPKSENLNVGFRCALDDTPATNQRLK
ncbi:MAG TPA: SUMF1/EgtB/PvdO family nonheme iron enzyme [Bryobacteraceae bacterium]|jgi:formylglycine-generating enzyme required for sulfatase activity